MSASLTDLAIPQSILDTDLYKLTMQQAVLHHFPDTEGTYRFTNRNKGVLFSRQCIERFRTAVSHFTILFLTHTEREWLARTCPYLTPEYLSYLSSYRFKPEQVKIKYTPVTSDNLKGTVDIDVSGPWVETILWEVPLMACLSECYFQEVDTDWNYDNQDELAYSKGKTLLENNCAFSEFGTRRRRSFQTQVIVIEGLLRASKDLPGSGKFTGTSNVHLAHLYGLSPIGTIAHEWFMGVGALKGYEHANTKALRLWEEVYAGGQAPLISLTDTFTTESFIKDMLADPELAQRWACLRQDSGDPFAFGPRVQKMYRALGIPTNSRGLIYSDALTIDKCVDLKKASDELDFGYVSFGIGTFLTNDFRSPTTGEKSKALNIVIKLSSVAGKPCVKLSDDLNKTTGDLETVNLVKKIYDFCIFPPSHSKFDSTFHLILQRHTSEALYSTIMADVRALLKAKRQEARITHPYAAYNSSGQLKCTVCSTTIKHASAWEGHLGSKAHRTNIIRLREEEKRQQQAREQEQLPHREESHSPEPTRKRKPDDDESQSSNGSVEKKRKVEEPSKPPQASSSSFPQDFFSDPSRGPVPLSYSDDEDEEEEPASDKPAPAAAPASGVDEEYERFQRELLSSAVDPTEAYSRATIAAEPVLAPTQIQGFPPTTVDQAPEEPPQLTEEEIRQKREQEERELIMDKLLAEERAQEDADTRVQLMKTKLENLRRKREAAKANKQKDSR
ncbi:putative nicotinate phosphoribosyltransferase [Psilocybe cubensis]|uniref:Nicotinate phosphoribosyltransferase n=2 Tax=Psilocybe cubensis TaxID=181762 RepID=A0ACB8H2W0_PSICU|nr:putative nicotinate phosphoribosyltransferase [Psilocybe cubensis]KAH9481535.1 putative nicotinate phosphoribosyltransferase [Psilocybe cubensis]